MDIYLTEVERLPETRRLRLTWNDGHRAELDYDYLRGYCPCATCQGHGVATVEFKPPAKPVLVGGVEEVGNYAISIAFSDGHDTGIYRFEFLRRICPCPECQGGGGRTIREESRPGVR